MTTGGILADVKVVEFAQNAAVPHCGRLLAGMGADVVKVEPPDGDAMRRLANLAPMEAKAYAVINPGKRSIVLDLGHPDGAEVVEGLFRWADVALVAFKQPDLERYGIDWERARGINPRLVHLTHTPFGPEGPDADVGGYDVLVQGLSGVGFIMNRSDGGDAPLPTRPAVNDFGTGFASALGVVAALRHRDLTGEGQRVDASLLGTAVSLGTPILGYFPVVDDEPVAEMSDDLAAMRAAGVDFDTQRQTYESRVVAGQGAFRLYFRHYATADGLVSVAGLSTGLASKFHEVTGLPRPSPGAAVDSPEFLDVVDRAEALFKTRTTAQWIEILRAAGYPCGRYNLPYEAHREPQIRANDYMVDLEHDAFGPYTTTGMPIAFGSTPNPPARPSPRFGAHTAEVLAEIGLTPERAAGLVADGVVHTGPAGDDA